MSLRQYIIIMIFATILCWVSLGFVVVNIDPFDANYLGFIFFFVSVFFSLVGTLSLLAFAFYSIFKKNEPLYRIVRNSFKDSVVWSGIFTVLLFLQGKDLLNIWNTLIFIGILVSLSIFMFFNKKIAVSR